MGADTSLAIEGGARFYSGHTWIEGTLSTVASQSDSVLIEFAPGATAFPSSLLAVVADADEEEEAASASSDSHGAAEEEEGREMRARVLGGWSFKQGTSATFGNHRVLLPQLPLLSSPHS